MTNRTPWTDPENVALVALYFTMLDCVTAAEPYSKAQLIRVAQGVDTDYTPALANRSRGSIEFKLMNASAAHADVYRDRYDREPLDTMHSHGYRALPNYQGSLAKAMEAELIRRKTDRNECQPETWRDRAANRS